MPFGPSLPPLHPRPPLSKKPQIRSRLGFALCALQGAISLPFFAAGRSFFCPRPRFHFASSRTVTASLHRSLRCFGSLKGHVRPVSVCASIGCHIAGPRSGSAPPAGRALAYPTKNFRELISFLRLSWQPSHFFRSSKNCLLAVAPSHSQRGRGMKVTVSTVSITVRQFLASGCVRASAKTSLRPRPCTL